MALTGLFTASTRRYAFTCLGAFGKILCERLIPHGSAQGEIEGGRVPALETQNGFEL